MSGNYKRTKKHKEKLKQLSKIFGFQKGHKLGMTGKKHSKKTKDIMRKTAKKIIHTKEWNKNVKKALKGKYTKENSCNWKGGKYKKRNRWYILMPKHIYIAQSRIIAEKILGRHLTKIEVIHHINGDTLDDRPENLYLFPSNSKHTIYHGLKNKPKLKSNLKS